MARSIRMTVETDGTREGTRVVDEATGKHLPFAVRPCSGVKFRPGPADAVLAIQFPLDECDEGEGRASLTVIPGGSA